MALYAALAGPDPGNPWSRAEPRDLPSPLPAGRPGWPSRAGALEFFGDDADADRAPGRPGAAAAELDAEHRGRRPRRRSSRPATCSTAARGWPSGDADLGDFIRANPDSVLPVIREIITGGPQYSAVDLFRAQHRLRRLRHAVGRVWEHVDALVLPTIGTTFTVDEVLRRPDRPEHDARPLHPVRQPARPGGARRSRPAPPPDGRPVSLMLVGPARSDLVLASLAARPVRRAVAGLRPPRARAAEPPSRPSRDPPPDPPRTCHDDAHRRQLTSPPVTAVDADPYPFEISLADTALVIIDMQRDFVEPGGFGESLGNDVDELRGVIPVLAGVLPRPARPACSSSTPARATCPTSPTARPRSCGGASRRCGSATRARTAGSSSAASTATTSSTSSTPVDGEPVVDKPGKGAFYATEFGDVLAARGITRLVVTGVTTEVCVHTTVREANDRGFECLVLSDCCGSYFPEFQRVGLEMVAAQGGIFGWVGDSADFLTARSDAHRRAPVAAADRPTSRGAAMTTTDHARTADALQLPLWVRGDTNAFFGLGFNVLVNVLVLTSLTHRRRPDPGRRRVRHDPAGARHRARRRQRVLHATSAAGWRARRTAPTSRRCPTGRACRTCSSSSSSSCCRSSSHTKDPVRAWQAGVAWAFIIGVIVLLGAFVGPFIRKYTPRAALLGTLAGISIAFISMRPGRADVGGGVDRAAGAHAHPDRVPRRRAAAGQLPDGPRGAAGRHRDRLDRRVHGRAGRRRPPCGTSRSACPTCSSTC